MFSKLNSLNSIDLSQFNFIELKGKICSDSRKICKDDIFVAYKGLNYDGRDFIDDAILKEAAIVIYDTNNNFHYTSKLFNINTKFLAINDLAQYAGIICSYILKNNLSKIPIIGITGTNGKTSVCFCLCQILELIGLKTGIIGTIGYGFIDNLINTNQTTPDAVNIQNYIHQLIKSNCAVIVIEVSSHGLDQFRVNGINFHTAIFTNLTRDHLDYHDTMENYGKIKSRLFYWNNLQHAIINIDDNYGKKLYDRLKIENNDLNITTYGTSKLANVKLKNISFNLDENIISLNSPWGDCIIKTSLIGKFNALNVIACLSAICGLGYSLDNIVSFFSKIKPVPGRLEKVSNNLKPLVIVDYAHTPDALKNCLLTLKEVIPVTSKLWCIFGCGGNRDKGKRSLMGEIAFKYADNIIITSDNPRFENPENIIKDILNFNKCDKVISIISRQEAIKYAVLNANYNDIILIAGKGHEKYQDINGKKYFFDDISCAYNYLSELRK